MLEISCAHSGCVESPETVVIYSSSFLENLWLLIGLANQKLTKEGSIIYRLTFD